MEQRLESSQDSPRWPRLTVALVAVAALFVLFAIGVSPVAPLDKADLVGYAICHRIPERSFAIGGRQLPLCARCTGTFLGALVGLCAALLRRRRASHLPPVPVLACLVSFIALWGFDGLNSYLTLFPGAPHLYEPRNWLRLTTGLLNGLALITLVLPIWNFTLWRVVSAEPVVKNLGELAAMLPTVAALVAIIRAEVGFLLYPLAIFSSLGVVLMLTLINSMIAAVVLGRESYARRWSQLLGPLTIGAALAVGQIAGMVLLRDYLTARFGLSF